MQAVYVMCGPRKMLHTCTCARGLEMEQEDRGNRHDGMRGGVRWWRGSCSEKGDFLSDYVNTTVERRAGQGLARRMREVSRRLGGCSPSP